jgi:hypothetical protein
MNEAEFGLKIKAVLDSSLALDPIQRARLKAARDWALSEDRQPVGAAELATAGSSGVRFSVIPVLVRVILPAAILIAAAFSWERWRVQSENLLNEDEMGQLDAELLKSDIPIDALLDRDFHAYMQKVMQRE